MRRAVTLLAAMAATVLALPAPAPAAGGDVAATHTYILSNYRLAREGVARIAPGQSRIEALIRRISRECPGAGAASPQDEQTGRFTFEVGVALWSVAYGTAAGPIRTFVSTVRRLHWSDPSTTRAAQQYASSLQALASLSLPPLCDDVRAWRASGYQVVPPRTLALDQRVEAIELHPLPARKLARFERGSDAGIFARTAKLERRLADAESNPGERDLLRLLDILSLQE